MKKNLLTPKFIEGSEAIAETVALCSPQVVAAYPITPQTHIVEGLAKLKANGKLKSEYLYAESEFAAASMLLGASLGGSRTYSATTSQGLLLMTEVLYNIAGLRLPVVMTIANRSVGAPLSIWNDTQDTVTLRDSGWLSWWATDLTEATLMHLAAFRVAEETSLPVLVNIDGFVLTHTAETVSLPTPALIKKFLPAFKPKQKLDPRYPRSWGTYARPAHYHLFRKDLHDSITASTKTTSSAWKELSRLTSSFLPNLAEGENLSSAEIVFVGSGSVMGTVSEAVIALRKKGVKAGLVNVRSLRPFPDTELRRLLKKAKYIAVLDKNISLGTEGVLATELRRALYGHSSAKIQSFIVGLGGKDVRLSDLSSVAKKVKQKTSPTVFV